MLLRLMLVVSVLLLAGCLLLARGCNIELVKANSAGTSPDRWLREDLDYARVLKLQRTATAAADNVDRPVHVIEAYRKEFYGMSYCIRFSAAGSCAGGLCQSFECVAEGYYKPGLDSEIEMNTVRCEQQRQYLCDIVQVRESAKNPVPGGWQNVDFDQAVVELHNNGAQLAAVKPGRVIEAYSAVAVGHKYCIRFESEGPAASCDAGGYLPPVLSGIREPINKIAVRCDVAVGANGVTFHAPMLMSMTSVLLVAVLLR